jgi:hypothetical protein
MRLICELTEELKIIEEAKDEGKKALYVEGIFLQGGIKNRNGRMYPVGVLQKEIKRYTESYISKNRAYGELGHPQSPTINLDRVSHLIKEIRQEGSNFIGKAKITEETPMGKIAAGLIREGAQLGISSRGLGSLRENKEGIMEVQGDFMLATAGDLVADPSAPDAWLSAVMESKEWVFENGMWKEVDLVRLQENTKKVSKKQLEEHKLKMFNKFLNGLTHKR